MNIKLVEELSTLMDKDGISKLTISDEHISISIEKGKTTISESPIINKVSNEDNTKTISFKSIDAPLVGTFYRSPGSDSKPYVELNQSIKKGDVLCIIEAMKVMNEIVAKEDGVIKEILMDDGMIVEFNQPMFVIE